MLNVLISGLPGKMASQIAETLMVHRGLMETDFCLLTSSLTGDGMPDETMVGWMAFRLIPPSEHQIYLQELWVDGVYPVVVDFTHPGAVNGNADLYCDLSIPFVMGTTGGDRDRLVKRVKDSEICAVIAPNMAAPVVAIQAMVEFAASNFPGIFQEYDLKIWESHQAGKADTSGTAKAMVGYFQKLGLDFTESQIEKVRDPLRQEQLWGVPREHLDGHGFHCYQLLSPDESVELGLVHNVCGRQVYVDGTILALNFLLKKISEGCRGQVFSMVDVLKS